MRAELIADFDFAALDAPAPPLREMARARLVLDAVLDALMASRLSQKELACRALALAITLGHWRVRGCSVRALARRIGVTHTALARRLSTLPEPFLSRSAQKRKGSSVPEGKRRQKVPRTAIGK